MKRRCPCGTDKVPAGTMRDGTDLFSCPHCDLPCLVGDGCPRCERLHKKRS